MPVVRLRQLGHVVDGAALLSPSELRGADHLAQPPVPFGIAGQHQQVPAHRVGYAALAAGQVQAELGAEDGAEPGAGLLEAGGRLGELGHPVHAVVIGDGQRFQAAFCRLGDQLLGTGCPVEEAVGRVAVQLGPRQAGAGAAGFVAVELVAAGLVVVELVAGEIVVTDLVAGGHQACAARSSTCVRFCFRSRRCVRVRFPVVRRLAGGLPPGQAPLELTPRERRIVPAHDLSTFLLCPTRLSWPPPC